MAYNLPIIKNLDSFRQQLVAILNLIDARLPLSGAGSPEGVVVASRGALYVRTDGSTSTTLYVKTADDGENTGWSAK